MFDAKALIAFEAEVARAFNSKEIRAPIHLDGGNEDQLIEIFHQEVGPNDWVLCSWRSHYKALLSGVPPDEVMAEILAGRSISLCFPKHRFLSSAIVGGILPIALGLAWSIKREGGQEKVWAFVGDMTARTGIFHEVIQYIQGYDLPLYVVVEDNGKSVSSPTAEVWGSSIKSLRDRIRRFTYVSTYPHSGAGVRVDF